MDSVFYIFILTSTLIVSTWWLWFIQYKKFFIDDTRQKLFSIRDELFIAASRGEISFDDKLYGMTRITLNGAIQYTHDLTVAKLLGSIILGKFLGETPQLKNYRDSWSQAFSELEPSAKKLILKTHRDMHRAMFNHIARSSLLLMAVIIPIGILLLLFKHKKLENAVVSNRARDEWISIDVETNSIGEKLALS